MIQTLMHHEVADYQSWRAVFGSALDFRQHGGERSCRIFRTFRTAGNPNDLTLLFEWEDLGKAQGYVSFE
jgi:hypothetical protein